MSTPTLDAIATYGNKPSRQPYETYAQRVQPNWIECADGFRLSVIAGVGAYCLPRPDWPFEGGAAEDYAGPYTAVEVGFPSVRPEPWEPVDGEECWSKYAEDPGRPTDTVYAYVPVTLVRHLLDLHGGEQKYLPAGSSPDRADNWQRVRRAVSR